MKKNIINVIFISAITVISLTFAGCNKNDGPIKKEILDRIDAVPAMTVPIDPTGSQSINMLDLASFNGKFSISSYFEDGITPDKVDIVVRKNGAVGVNVKVFKANVTTFPSAYTVNAAEIATLFGTPILLDDAYDFSADIYVGNKKFEAFPLGGVPNSSGPTGMPGYSHAARFAAICAYDPDIYEGDFEVVSDAWDELIPGELIELTRVSASSFSFKYPTHAINGSLDVPLVVNVNVGNNNVTMARKVIGTSWPWSPSYSGPAVATTGAATLSFVKPCDATLTLNINYTVDAGGFGSAPLVLRKKN